MKIEIEREEDGRWIAEVPVMPVVLAYGATRDEAIAKVQTLPLRCWRNAWKGVSQRRS